MSHYEASPRPGARLARTGRRAAASPAELRASALGRCIPIALLLFAAVAGLAWREHGSPGLNTAVGLILGFALMCGGALLLARRRDWVLQRTLDEQSVALAEFARR